MSNPLAISPIRFCLCCCYFVIRILILIVLMFFFVFVEFTVETLRFIECRSLFSLINAIPNKNVHSHALHDYLFQKKNKLHCLHKWIFRIIIISVHRHISNKNKIKHLKFGCRFFYFEFLSSSVFQWVLNFSFDIHIHSNVYIYFCITSIVS